MTLRDKSIHELRGIAQSFGIDDIFKKDAVHLAQEIEQRQEKLAEPKLPPINISYDIPHTQGSICSPTELTDALQHHIKHGLTLRFEPDHWIMSARKKLDTGSLTMPIRDIIKCADRVLA